MPSSRFRLLNGSRWLSVCVGVASWRVLTPSRFFTEGVLLLQAFGFAGVGDCDRRREFGILQYMPVSDFHARCRTVWALLQRDRDVLSYSYGCVHVSARGERVDAARASFRVRGLRPVIQDRPKGYCTLRLLDDSSQGVGKEVEAIDLRRAGRVVTDDGGHLAVRRRSMIVEWYREMPRILEFCEHSPGGALEVRRDT